MKTHIPMIKKIRKFRFAGGGGARRARLSAAVLAAVLAAGAPAGAQTSGTLATDKQQAARLAQEQNWYELETHTRRWVENSPYSWEGWYYLGLAARHLNKPDETLNFFLKAKTLAEDKRDVVILPVADAYAAVRQWPEAELHYRLYLKKNGQAAAAWGKLRAAVAEQPGESKRREESEILTKMFTFGAFVNDYDLWKRHAELFEGQGDIVSARMAYGHILRVRPDDLQTAEKAFQYDLEHGAADALKKSQNHLLKLDAQHPMVNVRLADLAFAKGKKRHAKRYYEAAAQNPEYRRETARALTGLAYLSGNNSRQALSNYLQAINTDPSYLPAWEGAITIFRHSRQTEQAAAYLSRLNLIRRRLEADQPVTLDLLQGLQGL